MMWMLLPRSAHTPHTPISRKGSGGAALRRMSVKELRFAGGDRTKTILDVMPLDEKILGFSNRWYKVQAGYGFRRRK
jgi:hypothetical protein